MPYILDCDPGHDDMVAIYLAARHLDLAAITTVSGNQSLEKVTRNARAIVELGRLTGLPVAAGLARPLVNDPVYAPEIHGESGLDGADLPEPQIPLARQGAVELILERSRDLPDLCLIATGPLTNVAAALIHDPGLAGRLRCISIMGGSLTSGNTTPAAEFNIWVDPEAADVVFRSGIPLKMFGLNVTRQASATREEIGKIAAIGTPFATAVAAMLEHYRSNLERMFGLKGASLHDALAVATFIQPSLFELEPMHVAIELHGRLTRGMTVCDRRNVSRSGTATRRGEPPNCEVAVGIDVPGFFDLLIGTLASY